jgi:hypothetical protein
MLPFGDKAIIFHDSNIRDINTAKTLMLSKTYAIKPEYTRLIVLITITRRYLTGCLMISPRTNYGHPSKLLTKRETRREKIP